MAADTQADSLDGPGSVVSHHSPKNRLRTVPTASGPGSTTLVRKGTGPRTQQGKERSKHNAVKHRIFSKAVVLKGESQAEYDALLNGLRNDRQPVGTLEELLVEKLATLFWRHRRLLIAEGAEIRASSEFVVSDRQELQWREVSRLPQLSLNGGLIRWIANPQALQGCLNLLRELKEGIEARGFVSNLDRVILTTLYGEDKEGNWLHTLPCSYLSWSRVAAVSEEERKQNGLPSCLEAKEGFLAELRKVIEWLGSYETN